MFEEKKDKQYVRYARALSYQDREAYEEYKAEMAEELKKAGKSIKGIWFEDEYKRVYPFGSVGSSVIGFVNGDGEGGTGGIEQYYNSTLMGTNGREYGYLNGYSNLERVIKPALGGSSVVSTIDTNIQKIVEKAIEQWEKETGSKRIGIIAMDPNNGEILAMAHDKTFDLNEPRKLRPEYTEDVRYGLGVKEAINDYRRKHREESPLTAETVPEHYSREEILSFGTQVAWNQTWRNFCVSDGYEPGSTEKIFTIAAALEEGDITGYEHYECQGFLEIGGYQINCVSRFGHGSISVERSLMKSCNVALMQIAEHLGKEKFYKYQQIFGFGSKTGIDLPGEADNRTLVYTASTANPTDLATNSFGQNFSSTMIQMAAAYASVINGGSYYEPHVVKQILNERGAVVKKVESVLVRETVSASTSRFINQALFKTVSTPEGSGYAASVEGYRVAGKTGTAEKIPRDKINYVVSFLGYVPAEDPQVLLYVVIDEPHVEDQAHSAYANQVFQNIMTELLPYMNLFPESLPGEEAGAGEGEGILGETPGASEGKTPPEESRGESPDGQEGTAEGTDGAFNGSEESGFDDGELPAALPEEGNTQG